MFNPITTLLGSPVEDLFGNTVGRVDDLLIDCDEGRIAYVRFTVAEVDLPEHRMTVPWSAVRVADHGARTLQIPVELATLRRLAAQRSPVS